MSNRHRQINSLRSYFPLTTIKSVVDLFQRLIDSNHQPDLTFLSILLGHIEHTLTCAQTPLSPSSSTYSSDYFIKQSDDSGSVSGASGDVDTNGNGKGSSASFISDHTASSSREELEIPPVKWDHVEPLYKKFISQIKGKSLFTFVFILKLFTSFVLLLILMSKNIFSMLYGKLEN